MVKGGMHGEGEGAYMVRGACVAKGGMHGKKGCVCGKWGSMHCNGGYAWQGACVVGEMATATDSTHPTECILVMTYFYRASPSPQIHYWIYTLNLMQT